MHQLSVASKNHKVVASPAGPFVPSTYLEERADDASAASSYHSRRLRSRSRGGSVSRSRDIVQDVYDRMGVNYVRGRPSIESFLKDPAIEADKSSANKDVSTLSTGDYSSEVKHTVSRLSNQWPPTNGTAEKGSTHSRAYSVPGKQLHRSSFHTPARISAVDSRDEAAKDHGAPEDERDTISVFSAKSSKSVKERISIYGESLRALNKPPSYTFIVIPDNVAISVKKSATFNQSSCCLNELAIKK